MAEQIEQYPLHVLLDRSRRSPTRCFARLAVPGWPPPARQAPSRHESLRLSPILPRARLLPFVARGRRDVGRRRLEPRSLCGRARRCRPGRGARVARQSALRGASGAREDDAQPVTRRRIREPDGRPRASTRLADVERRETIHELREPRPGDPSPPPSIATIPVERPAPDLELAELSPPRFDEQEERVASSTEPADIELRPNLVHVRRCFAPPSFASCHDRVSDSRRTLRRARTAECRYDMASRAGRPGRRRVLRPARSALGSLRIHMSPPESFRYWRPGPALLLSSATSSRSPVGPD